MVLGSVSFVSPGLVQTRRAVFGEVQQKTQPTGDYDNEDEIAVDVGSWHWDSKLLSLKLLRVRLLPIRLG